MTKMGTSTNVVVRQRNIERLIARCESIISGKTQLQGKDWKLPKYVASLDDQISQLEKFKSVNPDLLSSFRQRSRVLHDVLQNEEEIVESSRPTPHHTPSGAHHLTSTLSRQLSGGSGYSAPGPRLRNVSNFSPAHASTGGNELLLRATSKRESSMREQLFAKSGDEAAGSELEKKNGLEGSLDGVMERHQKMQEEVAEDMIKLTRSLKHNATVAKRIIQDDNMLLKKTSKKTDENITGVERETERLKKENKGCGWGVWLIMILVFTVFIAMVFFIRIVPKPRT